MIRYRLGLMLVSCASGAVAASAAEQSISKTVTGAFNTVVIQATTAATAATKAADSAIQGTQKKKSKESKASKSKDAEPSSKPATPGDKNSPPAERAKDATGKPNEATAAKKPPEPTEWPATEVELAKARCTQLLKTVEAVSVPEAPFRQGECGAPAPVRLISVGRNPEVSFSPPALVSCDMVVALHKWVKEDLQPLSKKHLGGPVVKIETMSDYSCRNAYGRIANKLSEHGKANALDIRGFVTNQGQQAVVLANWGQTQRDIQRQIAAAKAAAEKAEALKAAAQVEQAKIDSLRAIPTKTGRETGGRTADFSPAQMNVPRTTIIDGVPGVALQKDVGFGLAPTRLGGPKEEKPKSKREKAEERAAKKEAVAKAAEDIDESTHAAPGMVVAPPSTVDATTAFLHDAHASACRIFGTTLGPEANEAHRNHFHVDMAERKVKKICD